MKTSLFVFFGSLFLLNTSVLGQFDITTYAYEWDETGFIYFHNNTIRPGDALLIYKNYTGDKDHNLEFVRETYSVVSDTRYIKYQETFKGLEIEGAECVEHIQEDFVIAANGKVTQFDPETSSTPVITREEARAIALDYLGAEVEYAWNHSGWEAELQNLTEDPTATHYPAGDLLWALDNEGVDYIDLRWFIPSSKYKLAYKFEILAIAPRFHRAVYIDANNGNVIKVLELEKEGTADHLYYGFSKQIDTRITFTDFFLHSDDIFTIDVHTKDYSSSQPFSNLPDITDSDDIWGTSHQAHTSAHFVVTTALQFVESTWGLGSTVTTTVGPVHVMADAPNNQVGWMWTGGANLITIGKLGGNHASTMDIAAHEYEHAINEVNAHLVYEKEPGALDESYADIFGYMGERWAWSNVGLGLTAVDWTMGEDASTTRDMSNPNSFSDPDTYQGTHWFSVTSCNPTSGNDFCGVHTNSGVQNYWFHLMSVGGSGTNDNSLSYNIGGIGADDAFEIVVETMLHSMTSHADYSDARAQSVAAAKKIFGNCSGPHEMTMDAWDAVGVTGNNPCNTIGYDEAAIYEHIEIYPNPTTDVLNISFRERVSCTLKVVAIDGAVIKTKEIIDSEECSIDVSDLANGLYFIRQSRDGAFGTVKFIKN